jgi:hypothetical protein
MTTYLATSRAYGGCIALTYNEEDQLAIVNLSEAQLSPRQREWVLRHAPLHPSGLPEFARHTRSILTEQPQQITFEMFYQAYGVKEARKKAQTAWNKLSRAEQVKAYRYIPRLKNKYLNSGVPLPYPATYLNQQRWND